jgi:hypothetical protein
MPKKKLPRDVQRICLCAEELNALLTLLDKLGNIDVESDNSILTDARMLKEKFLRYGKKYEKDGDRFASFYLFPSEVSPLLRILTLELACSQPASRDYYAMIGNKSIVPDTNERKC